MSQHHMRLVSSSKKELDDLMHILRNSDINMEKIQLGALSRKNIKTEEAAASLIIKGLIIGSILILGVAAFIVSLIYFFSGIELYSLWGGFVVFLAFSITVIVGVFVGQLYTIIREQKNELNSNSIQGEDIYIDIEFETGQHDKIIEAIRKSAMKKAA